MSIDWSKVMNKPDTLQKIRGKLLLELRSKIVELEKNLTQNKNEITVLNDRLTSTVNDFEGKLKKAIEEKKENEIKLNGFHEKIIFLERTLLNKERDIKELEKEKNKQIQMLQADIAKNIKQNEIDNKNYNQKIQNKDSEIRRLSNDTEKFQKEAENKTKEINDLIKKFKELEIKLSNRIILSTKLIRKIEKLMAQKGFINDKEFETLKRRLVERQISINN